MLTTLPSSDSLVFSPKYHTFPRRSWAYQSRVSSTSSPPMKARSRTTTVSTPCTVLVLGVTVTTSRLSIVVVNRAGSGFAGGITGPPTAPSAGPAAATSASALSRTGAARRVLAMPVILAHRC